MNKFLILAFNFIVKIIKVISLIKKYYLPYLKKTNQKRLSLSSNIYYVNITL